MWERGLKSPKPHVHVINGESHSIKCAIADQSNKCHPNKSHPSYKAEIVSIVVVAMITKLW